MDVATLYMVVTLAERAEARVLRYPTKSHEHCLSLLEQALHTKMAEDWRKRGAQVEVNCGPPDNKVLAR